MRAAPFVSGGWPPRAWSDGRTAYLLLRNGDSRPAAGLVRRPDDLLSTFSSGTGDSRPVTESPVRRLTPTLTDSVGTAPAARPPPLFNRTGSTSAGRTAERSTARRFNQNDLHKRNRTAEAALGARQIGGGGGSRAERGGARPPPPPPPPPPGQRAGGRR